MLFCTEEYIKPKFRQMKYHSPLSIIIISIIVLLLFVSVAYFAVFSLGMTSPTLIVAEKLMDDLRASDSPLSFSFDSIDRNFKGGFTVNNIEVGYNGENVAEIETLRVHMGIPALVRYLITGSGHLEVEGMNGSIAIPAIAGGGAAGSGIAWGNHTASLHLHDIDISGYGVNAENTELSFYLEDDGIRSEMVLPHTEAVYEGYNLASDDIAMTIVIRSDISVSLSASLITLDSDSLKAAAERPILRYSVSSLDDLDSSSLALSVASFRATGGDYSISMGHSSLFGDRQDAEAVLTDLKASFSEYSFATEEADLRIRDKVVSLSLNDSNASKDGISLYRAERTELEYSIPMSSFSLTVPLFSSDVLRFADSDLVIEGSDISFKGRKGDTSVLSASGKLSAVRTGSVLDGTAGDFSLYLREQDGKIVNGEFSISDFILPGIDDEGRFYLRLDNGHALIQGSFGSHFSLSGSAGDGLRLNAYYSALPLRPFAPFVKEYVPVIYNYIGEDTAATGSLSVNFDSDMTGPVDFVIALSEIAFNDFSFSLAAAGSGTLSKNGAEISQLSLTSDFVRASFDGNIDFRTKLPEGRFVLSMTDSGYELLTASLTLESDEEYYFNAEIPYFSSSYLRGNVNWSDESVIDSIATLKSGNYYYPFHISIDFEDNLISIENDHLHSAITFGDMISGSVNFDRFELPVISSREVSQTYLDGVISASFSFSEQQFILSSDDFRIGNIGLLPDQPDLFFSIRGDNSSLAFTDILFTSPSDTDMRGNIFISFMEPSIAASLESDDDERLLLSIVRNTDGMFSGLLRADGFYLDRLGIDGMVGDLNLTARAGTWDSLMFSGSLRSYSRDMINDPQTIEGDLYINRNEIVIRDISYTAGSLSLHSDSISFSSETGLFDADVKLMTSLARADGPQPVTSSVTMGGKLRQGSNLADSFFSMYKEKFDNAALDITVKDTNIGNKFLIDERSIHLVNNDGKISITGSLASGYYDGANRLLSLRVDLNPVAEFSVEGILGTARYDSELRILIDSFEISVANLFITPSISFIAPAPATGEIIAVKDGSTWNLSGYLAAEEVSFDLFWMPDERVILHNPYFAVWDNSFVSLIDDCTVFNKETYERTPGRVALTIELSDTLSFDGWKVDVYADEGNWIGIRLPILSSNIDIWGDVTGYLQVGSEMDDIIYLNGDLNASNLTMSIGMEPMPEWMGKSKKRVTSDLKLLLTENVKFLFPLTGDPVLRADLAEYQNLRVQVDGMGGMEVSGSLDIRSGEIFYFQKNFYITEGNISFMQNMFESTGFNPIINLRARLRDFDSDGNPVDIYLILRNATMDNLSPSFESSPAKPLSEIMQILGQSILPNSVYGDITVSSMVSLVSASFDILSRFGIIRAENENTLEQSIRTSLSLDTFSLHTNIIENLIFDTVSYAASNIDSVALSPMARYLDGTTLYLGKYLSPQLYLEGMIHLDAESNAIDRSHTFLADDLNLDIEISLEWDNPLAVFTIFTQPENITFYDIIDTFGFGISKRIVW